MNYKEFEEAIEELVVKGVLPPEAADIVLDLARRLEADSYERGFHDGYSLREVK